MVNINQERPACRQAGIAHLLLILIAAVGIIAFILFSSSADFKNKLFSTIFPNKPKSHATAEVTRVEVIGPNVSRDGRYANNQSIQLRLNYVSPPPNYPTPSDYRVANSANDLDTAAGVAFSPPWVPYQDNEGNIITPKVINWQLSPGDGSKIVYVQFKLNGVWQSPISTTIQYISGLPMRQLTETKQVKTFVVEYYPNGDFYHPQMSNITDFTKNTLLPAMTDATRYHGYVNPNAMPALHYTLADTDIKIENSPPPHDSSGSFDYDAFFNKYDLCNYARQNDIKAVIVWAGDTGEYAGGLWESVATGDRTAFPMHTTSYNPIGLVIKAYLCSDKAITVYGLNYARGLAEALESHAHFLEGMFANFLDTTKINQWTGRSYFVHDPPDSLNLVSTPFPHGNACGTPHNPPNARCEYDAWNPQWDNPSPQCITTVNNGNYATTCRNWKPDNQGISETINCTAWGCTRDGYLKWWMQNMPGLGTNLTTLTGQKIPNWWDYIGDPENCYDNPFGCNQVADVVTYQLNAGWNLFGVSLTPSSALTASNILSQTGSNCSEIDRWDVPTQVWQSSANDFPIEAGRGYAIKCSTNGNSFTISGTPINTLPTLSYGWNLVSLPYNNTYANVSDFFNAFNVITKAIPEIDRYINGGWDGYLTSLGLTNFPISKDQGYFVKYVSGGSTAISALSVPSTPTSSPTSSPIATPVPDTTPPSAPTGFTVTATAYNKVDLSWNLANVADGVVAYYVIRNNTNIAKVAGSATSYSDTTVSQSTTYNYQIIALDNVANSASSDTKSETTPAVPDTKAPSDPTNLIATAFSSSQINLSWTASTDENGVAGYDIYRNGIKLSSPVTTNSFGDTGLSASTSYSYYVIAFDSAGNHSNQSNPVTATTQAAAPVPTTGIINGKVCSSTICTLTDGTPLTKAQVSITINGITSTFVVDTLGRYSFTNLLPNTYPLYYAAKSYKTQKSSGTVAAGQTLTKNVTLTK